MGVPDRRCQGESAKVAEPRWQLESGSHGPAVWGFRRHVHRYLQVHDHWGDHVFSGGKQRCGFLWQPGRKSLCLAIDLVEKSPIHPTKFSSPRRSEGPESGSFALLRMTNISLIDG